MKTDSPDDDIPSGIIITAMICLTILILRGCEAPPIHFKIEHTETPTKAEK